VEDIDTFSPYEEADRIMEGLRLSPIFGGKRLHQDFQHLGLRDIRKLVLGPSRVAYAVANPKDEESPLCVVLAENFIEIGTDPLFLLSIPNGIHQRVFKKAFESSM